MNSVKESLHNTVEILSDEEAHQVLEFAQRLRKKGHSSPTLKRLENDLAFKVPSEKAGRFRIITPIQGRGIEVSRLLIEDRRCEKNLS